MLTSLNRWLSFYCIDYLLEECYPCWENSPMEKLRAARKAPLDLDVDIAEQTLKPALARSWHND